MLSITFATRSNVSLCYKSTAYIVSWRVGKNIGGSIIIVPNDNIINKDIKKRQKQQIIAGPYNEKKLHTDTKLTRTHNRQTNQPT